MPALLLLPGLDGTGRLLEDFAAAVGNRCRVVMHLLLQTRPAEAAALVADFARKVCSET